MADKTGSAKAPRHACLRNGKFFGVPESVRAEALLVLLIISKVLPHTEPRAQ